MSAGSTAGSATILWVLNEYGRQRFVELERRITSITPKVLTQRLGQLERDGLIVRTYHPEVPPRVEYEISELGLSLAPLFAALAGPPPTWTRSRRPGWATTAGHASTAAEPDPRVRPPDLFRSSHVSSHTAAIPLWCRRQSAVRDTPH